MGDDLGDGWGQWCDEVVEGAVKAIIGGELWVLAGGAYQVQGYFRLGNQEIPLGKGGFWVAGGDTGTKVVFPGLDGAIGGIAAVYMWQHYLEGKVVFIEGFLHLKGAFVS